MRFPRAARPQSRLTTPRSPGQSGETIFEALRAVAHASVTIVAYSIVCIMMDMQNLLVREGVRRKVIDKLLPAPLPPAADDEILSGTDGIGVFRHTRESADSPRALWGPLDQYRLSSCLVADPLEKNLDALLTSWRERLREEVDIPAHDLCASISWPSRDTAASPILERHGFRPSTSIGVRVRTNSSRKSPPPPREVSVRPATLSDLEGVRKLWEELVHYDAQFGSTIAREGMEQILRNKAREAVLDQVGWTLVAEVSDDLAGFVRVASREHSTWTSGLIAVASTVYLEALSVTPNARGLGIGSALANAVHRLIDAAAIDATLLHYTPSNPLSAPFWHRMSYRPLWTTWRTQQQR